MLVTTSISWRGLGVAVAILDQKAAEDPFDVAFSGVTLAALLRTENADRLLLLQYIKGAVFIARGDQNLDEVLIQRLGQLHVNRSIEADHAAEGRHRIAGKRLLIGLQGALADRDPAGIVVLDDDAGRLRRNPRAVASPSRGRARC